MNDPDPATTRPGPPLAERAATDADAPAIAALIRALATPFFVSPDGEGAEPFLESVSPPAIARCIVSPAFDYRVVEHDGVIVAAAAMRDARHLYHLFVATTHQGRGLGRALWHQLHARAMAAATDGHDGRFTVNASLNAVPVYERLGFVPAGDVQRLHGIAFRPMVRDGGGPSSAHASTSTFAPASRP